MKGMRDISATGFLVLLGATAFLLTRAARVELKYGAMNPIREKGVLARVSRAGLGRVPEELRKYLTKGSETAAETLYIPPPTMLKLLSLGRVSALADIVFVRAHAYFLSHFFADRVFAWLDNYFTAAVGLDPNNPRVYLWAGQVVKYGQQIDDRVVERSNRFLEKGLDRFPNDWRLHVELGFNLYFEFKGRNKHEKELAKLKAREHFAKAATLPGSPIDPNLVFVAFERDKEEGLALAYALQKYFEADNYQREQLYRRIRLISQKLAEQLKDEERRWKKEMPFVPPYLYSAVGPLPKPPPAPELIEYAQPVQGEGPQ